MISRCTKQVLPKIALPISLCLSLAATVAITGCSSSSTSSTGSTGTTTQVSMFAMPSPSTAAAMAAGNKVVVSDTTDEITITKAYLVVSSTTIETTCDNRFSAELKQFINNPLEYMIKPAYAHTTPTPTSTGTPYVIDLLAMDNAPVAIGSMSPSVADYCGVDVDMFAADADAQNLPGDVDMVGRSLYIEATYQNGPSGAGAFTIDTSATLINRYFLLSALMMISADNPTDSVALGINYDTWFNGLDLGALQTETAVSTNPGDPEVSALLQNITSSIHHLP